MKLIDIMRIVAEAYAFAAIQLAFDHETGAPTHRDAEVGDGLATFIVEEIYETYERSAGEAEQLDAALGVMQRAQDDLARVVGALSDRLHGAGA